MFEFSNYDFNDLNEDFEFNSNFEQEQDHEEDQDQDQDQDQENEDSSDDNDYDNDQSRQTSPTWKYFNKKTCQNPGHPVCIICRQVFGKKTGITTLKRHLDSIHKI